MEKKPETREREVIEFLRERRGESWCSQCLAKQLDLGEPHVRTVIATIQALGYFSLCHAFDGVSAKKCDAPTCSGEQWDNVTRASAGSYDSVMQAIGDVCQWWVSFDEVIHEIVLHLTDCLEPQDFNDQRASWHALHIALSRMDTRGKIATAKALSHKVDVLYTTESPKLYEKAVKLLNHVDVVVREERNRYVHDLWKWESGGQIVRVKMGARVSRPKAGHRELSIWSSHPYKSMVEIDTFVKILRMTYQDLVEFDHHLAWLSSERQQDRPATPPPPLPLEWKSLAHRDWRTTDTL